MRIQIIDLPSQHVGDVMTSPNLLVLSEMPTQMESAAQAFRKDGFDHCAGIIVTTEPVRIGEETDEERAERESRSEQRRIDELLIETKLPPGSILRSMPRTGIVDAGLMWGSLPRDERQSEVACPEQAESRGCACARGAQDCPVSGRTPAAIGIMDIAPEERAVSVTENEGGTRVAHIAIDVDQTPEELASDVAAIVEEQREQALGAAAHCRGDSHCPSREHIEGCFRAAREYVECEYAEPMGSAL